MMETRKIDELKTDELRKVWQVNGQLGSTLHQEVSEDMQESEMFWVEEILDVMKDGLSSWDIGFCNRNQHVRAKDDERDFIDAVKSVQRHFGFLPDSYNEKIDKVSALVDEWYDTEIDSDRYDELEDQVEAEIKEIENDITNQFTENLDGALGEEEEYFVEFYADSRFSDDVYINSDYELFEDVSYTKSYAM